MDDINRGTDGVCYRCDGDGEEQDPDWCGDEDHCSCLITCRRCHGTGKEPTRFVGPVLFAEPTVHDFGDAIADMERMRRGLTDDA